MLRRGALLFPLLVLFAGASLIREAAVGVLSRCEEQWTGFLMRQANHAKAAPTTLIEINEDTKQKHAWPWPAADLAVFFHATIPFEPALISVEPILDGDKAAVSGGESNESFERMLHDGILRAPKLILGGTLGYSQDSESVPELRPMPVLHNIRGDVSKVPEFVDVVAWADEKYRLSTKPGWLNVPDDLGPFGRCPLIFRYHGQPVPAFTLQMAMMWEKVTADEVEIVLGSHIMIGTKRVPIDAAGRMNVSFGASFARVSYDDLLLTREQLDRNEAPAIPASEFANRVILLGQTDAEQRTIETPSGAKISPSELFASAVSTIQANAFPHRVPAWIDWLFVGLVAGASLWILKSKATIFAISVIVAEALFIGTAIYLYRAHQILLPGVMPFCLALWMLILRAVARRTQRVIAF